MTNGLQKTLINKNIKILNKYLVNHVPNNNCGKKHTLNRTIQILKNDKEYIFDLTLIKKFLNRGATPNNNTTNNTLTLALTYAERYIAYHKSDGSLAEDCMVSYIQVLINAGAEPSNAQDESNTLSTVIRTRSLKLINIIAELNPLPDNNQYGNHHALNTLTLAVNTGMNDIVKIACILGGIPDLSYKYLCDQYNKNTLLCAIMTKNIEIVKEIIFVGGKCESNCFYIDDYFHIFQKKNHQCESNYFYIEDYFEDDIFVNIINLLLCSGTKIARRNKKICGVSQYVYNKMISYLVLSQTATLHDGTHISVCEEIDKLRHTLKYTMDDLIVCYESRCLKKNDLANILMCIPLYCVDIIYGYSPDRPFEIIDWMVV